MTNGEEEQPAPANLPIAPAAIQNAVLAELDRTAAFVRGIDTSNWKRASAARGWAVGDVVAHLSLAMGLYNRVVGAAVSGRAGGSMWRAMGEVGKRVLPAAAPMFNTVNRAIPRLMDRSLAPEVIQGQYAANARELRERLASLEPLDFTRPVHYLGATMPLSYFLAQMMNELAVHGWDMESVLEPTAHLSGEARAMVPWFYWSGTTFLFRPASSLAGDVQVLLDDPAGEMWWHVAGKDTQEHRGRAPRADATIIGNNGVYVLTLAGRMTPGDAVNGGSLRLEGNEQLARDFLSSWKLV